MLRYAGVLVLVAGQKPRLRDAERLGDAAEHAVDEGLDLRRPGKRVDGRHVHDGVARAQERVELLHVVVLAACALVREAVLASQAPIDVGAPGIHTDDLASRCLRPLDERRRQHRRIPLHARASRDHCDPVRHVLAPFRRASAAPCCSLHSVYGFSPARKSRKRPLRVTLRGRFAPNRVLCIGFSVQREAEEFAARKNAFTLSAKLAKSMHKTRFGTIRANSPVGPFLWAPRTARSPVTPCGPPPLPCP